MADTVEARRRILRLALPIVGGMLSQTALNVTDTAMVATLGDTALAAVGLASNVNALCFAFFMGMAAGVQATIARWRGETREGSVAVPLNGGLLLALGIGLPLSLVLIGLAPSLLALLEDDPAVRALGTPYLQVRLLGVAGVGMNFAFRGYWNAIERSGLYLRTILLIHVVNVALDYVLIFGHLGAPPLGVLGAAIASTVAVYVGLTAYVVLGLRVGRADGFLRGIPDGQTMRALLRMSLPAAMQQVLFFAGLTAFYVILGAIGTADLAAGTVLVTLMLVAILPANAFGLAAASLVGQSLGAGKPNDADRWAKQVLRLGIGVVTAIALPALVAPDLILAGFLDEATRALASTPLRLLAFVMPFDALGLILMNAHLGAGRTATVLKVTTLLQWGVFLPVAWLLVAGLGLGSTAVWTAYVLYRLVQSALFVQSWRSRRWAH